MRKAAHYLILVAAGLGLAGAGPPTHSPGSDEPIVQSARVLSKTYLVDRKYRSMLGPQSVQPVFLADPETPELLWVTGFRAVMVGPDGETLLSQEFMCHSNLDLNMSLHNRLFGVARESPGRVFTLSQGQQEISFPKGFGLPIVSTEAFNLTTQVLNHNIESRAFQVRHKVTIDYIRDRDLKRPMTPLFQLGVNGLVLVEGKDGYFNVPEADPNVHGPGCLPGQSATTEGFLVVDDFGRRFSSHWTVKPGREVNRTNVTKALKLPFDTTVHYIAVHLHPFAESLELRDLTAGSSLYLSKTRPSVGKIGLDQVDSFSSEEGIPLFRDHEYELISVYNNTSRENQDSMAVMYLYCLDKEFQRPQL